MIEVLPDMPEGVTGIRVSGRLRGDDLREFKSAMEEPLGTGEIRIVEVVAPDDEGFGPGGPCMPLRLSITHCWANCFRNGSCTRNQTARRSPSRTAVSRNFHAAFMSSRWPMNCARLTGSSRLSPSRLGSKSSSSVMPGSRVPQGL